jgi:predicted KAP-like P-loop ATPase
MTIEEFQTQRRQEMMMEERRNLKRLEEETAELANVEKVLRQDNKELQRVLDRLEH